MQAPAHPLRLDSDGTLAVVQDEAVVRQSLAQLAGTRGVGPRDSTGELPWAPEYGASLDVLRFGSLGGLLAELVSARVVGQAQEHEPRARITSVKSTTNPADNSVSLELTFGSPTTARDSVVVQR